MRFADIYTHVENITRVTDQRNLIKEAIRRGLYLATSADLSYLDTEGVILTIAPYTTGTVSVTADSKTVTGSGTTFTAAMAGRKIRIAGNNEYYRIDTRDSDTQLTLEQNYQGATASGQTYSIFKDEYRLAADLATYKIMRELENNQAMVDISPTTFDLLRPSSDSEGTPDYMILRGTKLDTYATGTVSGTVNTKTVTGASSPAWTTVEGLGQGSKITIDPYVYTVNTVDSDTQLTIHENLTATVASGTTYTIHLDNPIIQFFQIPDSATIFNYTYQRLPYPLIDDADIPDLPEQWHHLLVRAGLIWAWATKDKEESKAQEALFALELQNFWSKAAHISRYRTISRRIQGIYDWPLKTPVYPDDYGVSERLYR